MADHHLLLKSTIIIWKITLLHSVSVITNFAISKRDKQINRQKTPHSFVHSRHGSVVSSLGAIDNLLENTPTAGKCLYLS